MLAIISTNTTVLAGTSAAVRLAAGRGSLQDPLPVTVYNPGVAGVFLGGPGVTAASGIPLAINTTWDFSLVDGDEVWAITSTVTTTVRVMIGRQ